MSRSQPTSMLKGTRTLWIGLAVFAALLAYAWVGFIASDDVTYALGAYGWIEQFPYVGGHGTIRYPITIPMALSFLTLGENSFAMVLPSLAYVLAFLVMAWWASRRVAGEKAAFASLAALVTMPLIVVQSTIAGVDVIELAFVFGAFLLTWDSIDKGKADSKRLFAAGVLTGLAFLTRETAIFIVPFYAILFLAGYRIGRWSYLWVAAGFVSVWMAEVLYLWAMTGDPLYRINISLNHDSSIDRSIDLAGNVIAHPLVDPFLTMLLNQEFMLLLPIGLPLAAWLCLGSSHPERLQRFARLAALLAVTWFVAVGAATTLLPLNPRYFMVTAALLALLAGLGLARLVETGIIWAAILLASILLATNALGIWVEDKNPVFAEHKLVEIARKTDRTVHTDPMTLYRAGLLLKWAGEETGAVDSPVQPGDLFYANPTYAAAPNFKMDAAALPAFQPKRHWDRIATYRPRQDGILSLMEATGVTRFVPPAIWNKLTLRTAPVALYEVR